MRINGKKIAKAIRQRLKKNIARLDFQVGLAALLIGNDKASHLYIRIKEIAAKETGIWFEKFLFPKETRPDEIKRRLIILNHRSDIHAILVQLPLPSHIPTQEIINAVDPKKDVDGFHPKTLQQLGTPQEVIKPVLAEAILEILISTGEDISNKSMLIIGNSQEFLNPLCRIFQPLCKHVQTAKKENFHEYSKGANIIIIAIGQTHVLKTEHITKDSILIDIGINVLNGKTFGDVDPACYEMAKFYTPVPGGIGPVTVAKLLENAYKLACHYQS